VSTFTSDYQDVKRSRDPAVLDICDIVVDVGAIYDESKQRFDHHQRGFTEVFGHGFSTKLSSAGLIYKYGWLYIPVEVTDNSMKAFRQGGHCKHDRTRSQ